MGMGIYDERTQAARDRIDEQMETAANRMKKSKAKPAKLGRDVQAKIGQQLRAMYDDVAEPGRA